MKKIIALISILSLLTIGFISCSGNSGKASLKPGFDRMPSSMETFIYLNVDKSRKIHVFSSILEEKGEMKKLFDQITEMYIAVEDLSYQKMDSVPENTESIGYEVKDFVVMMVGNFNKEEIKEGLKINPNTEEKTFFNIEAMSNDSITILFVDDSNIIMTTSGFENTVIDAYLNGNNTVDKNSPEYKALKGMNYNTGWAVLNLSKMGKINLPEKTSGLLRGETSFGITKCGISIENSMVTFEASSIVDNEEVAQTVATSMNDGISMARMAMAVQIAGMGLTEDTKKEVEGIMDGIEVIAQKNILSIEVSIKNSTLNEFTQKAGL